MIIKNIEDQIKQEAKACNKNLTDDFLDCFQIKKLLNFVNPQYRELYLEKLKKGE